MLFCSQKFNKKLLKKWNNLYIYIIAADKMCKSKSFKQTTNKIVSTSFDTLIIVYFFQKVY